MVHYSQVSCRLDLLCGWRVTNEGRDFVGVHVGSEYLRYFTLEVLPPWYPQDEYLRGASVVRMIKTIYSIFTKTGAELQKEGIREPRRVSRGTKFSTGDTWREPSSTVRVDLLSFLPFHYARRWSDVQPIKTSVVVSSQNKYKGGVSRSNSNKLNVKDRDWVR